MKVLSELDVMASIGEEIDKISADELLKRGADMPDVQEGEEVIVVKTRGTSRSESFTLVESLRGCRRLAASSNVRRNSSGAVLVAKHDGSPDTCTPT
jgi:hypothetical protein